MMLDTIPGALSTTKICPCELEFGQSNQNTECSDCVSPDDIEQAQKIA